MRKKTNFEQVPLEVVKKVVEEQVKREETSEADRGVKKEEWDHLQTTPFGGQHLQPHRKGVTTC